MIKEVLLLLSINPTIHFMKVKAHSNKSDFFSMGNCKADKLAKQGCSFQKILSKRMASTQTIVLEKKVKESLEIVWEGFKVRSSSNRVELNYNEALYNKLLIISSSFSPLFYECVCVLHKLSSLSVSFIVRAVKLFIINSYHFIFHSHFMCLMHI